MREDDVYVDGEGAVLDARVERIFVVETWFDAVNARKLAGAILEACDRLDAAGAEQ